MGWTEPKTDWDADDRLDAVDYNRIKNNLLFLSELAGEVYCAVQLDSMGEDKEYGDWFFAREFNVLESNLDMLNRNAFLEDIGTGKTFFPNGFFIDYEELNRIGTTTLRFREKAEAQKKLLQRMAFRLGSGKGVR